MRAGGFRLLSSRPEDKEEDDAVEAGGGGLGELSGIPRAERRTSSGIAWKFL